TRTGELACLRTKKKGREQEVNHGNHQHHSENKVENQQGRLATRPLLVRQEIHRRGLHAMFLSHEGSNAGITKLRGASIRSPLWDRPKDSGFAAGSRSEEHT